MSQDLQGFYAQNVEKLQNHKTVISNRFKDAEGKALVFEFKAISNEENFELRKQCISKRAITQGKNKGQHEEVFDNVKYQSLVTVNSFVYPNLRDVKLQESYGVMNELDLFNKMFSASEANDCQLAANEANSHDKDMADLVEEVKN